MPCSRSIALAAVFFALLPAAALAGPIQDNSFLLEEAYNQEPGVIQHISAFNRSSEAGAWVYSFTEEWPIRGQTHQGSVTFNFADLGAMNGRGVGDVLLNYRWQAVGSGETPVAFAPRLTAVLPTGDSDRGLGGGGAGIEVNLPLSVELGEHFVSHVNLGGRYVPSAKGVAGKARYGSFTAGQSFIWLAHQNLNFMVETVYSSSERWTDASGERTESLTINPGIRAALNLGGLQVVPGLAFPMGIGPSQGSAAVFFYLSFEHPFQPAGPLSDGK